jgi:hypothetical protein
MKIGILEIMPQGHYTLVDSIARIYASDSQNEIFICTHEKLAEVLKPLLNENIGDIKLVVKNKNESLVLFFEKVNQLNLNLLFIATLEKYFKPFYNFNFNCALSFFIHDIDSWFLLKLKYKIYNILNDFSFSPRIIYKLKVSFIYTKWRARIVDKILYSGGRFVVLNKNLKNELSKYVSEERIDVIPFSVFNKNLKDNSINNNCLRICIPGWVSQLRRDYFSVLKMFEEDIDFYRGKVELDLLGCVVKIEQGREIIKQAERLNANGIKVNYYDIPFIPVDEFDAQLSKADIILGNMNVVLNKYSKYGKTKDTGIIFTMIRAAKPGILPIDYALIDELKSSSVIYEDYLKLRIIIKNLVENKIMIDSLKKEAQKNSLLFDPCYIYKNLPKARELDS